MTLLTAVVAASDNDVIGSRGALPWHLPEDLRRFRQLTWGRPVIMGRKTFEAIGRPLPGRRNIVVSRRRDLAIDGCEVVPDTEAALALVARDAEAMVIGGEQIYRQLLPLCARLQLTRVHTTVDGDAHLPAVAAEEWREVAREEFPAGETRPLAYTFLTLERASV